MTKFPCNFCGGYEHELKGKLADLQYVYGFSYQAVSEDGLHEMSVSICPNCVKKTYEHIKEQGIYE